ncbi:HlyD family efflux transporter periplasmic adaptor subunit [Siculibacillus lacustris]|nr:HlyD family efflux transporter periplasmic adaptor subunit [Siculibacillus lacustris]
MADLYLPEIRDDLMLFPGPTEADGSPSWTIGDPARNKFFRIGWPAFEIIARWVMGDADAIAADVGRTTPLTIDAEDVVEVGRFLVLNQLVRADRAVDTRRLATLHQRERSSILVWLLHHYLFFRIPLVRPDAFLERLLPRLGWLGGRRFLIATVVALAVGLVLLVRQIDVFAAEIADSFNWQGAASYAVALIAAKIVHESAHAFVAKAAGCRVGTMGLAFLVMWPVLYTDVNESWKLPSRRARLAIGSAGILAELVLASWALAAWGLLPDGAPRQAALVLATTTLVSSLLLNLSPFMRFDGYFLLMDALGVPNLHGRAFAMARWGLRECLFDLREPPPETFAPVAGRLLIAFAWVVWIYRLVVFLGIALLVYHFIVKIVGILLFAVEIGWFVVLPVWTEIRAWATRGGALFGRPRGWITVAVGGLVGIALLVPIETSVSGPAIRQAAFRQPLFAASPGILRAVEVRDGDRVAVGTPLFRFESPDLAHRIDGAARRIALAERALRGAGFDASMQQRTQSSKEQLLAATAQKLAAERERSQLTLVSTVTGRITDLAPDVAPGQWISPRLQLATLIADGNASITAYVGEEDIERIEPGARARFFAAAPGWSPLTARVATIERVAVRHLDAPSLASFGGGPIAVRPGDRELTPTQALYRVRLTADEPAPAIELRGTIHIAAAAASPVSRFWRAVAGIVLRESGM